MKFHFPLWLNFLFLLLSAVPVWSQAARVVDYVNPFMGSYPSTSVLDEIKANEALASGCTNPAARVPWGMVSANPRTGFNPAKWERWDAFSTLETGYIHNAEYMYGFSQLNLSGVGCSDWGQVLLLPTAGPVHTGIHDNRSKFSEEKASPGYYTAHLDFFGVKAEMTATERTTLMRLSYPKATGDANIIADLHHSQLRGRDAAITKITKNTMEGWVYNGGFCGTDSRQKVYFVIAVNKQASTKGIIKEQQVRNGAFSGNGTHLSGFWTFDMMEGEQLLIKTGISFVSLENARENLLVEQPSWDFDGVRAAAETAWEKELSKIKVEGGTEQQKTMFYSALYQSLIHPSVFQDVNGEYLTIEHKNIKKLEGQRKDQYTVYSLWDTYRNLHPLLTLVYPDRQLDMVRTMVDHAKEHGELPFWELGANETYIMVGDPANPVIADTYLKGLTDFDVETAFEAMVNRATTEPVGKKRTAIKEYVDKGYVPLESSYYGAVSMSLEYYYADWCIAQLAKALGKSEREKEFAERAGNYRKLFDTETGFMRPKMEDGSWLSPFNPDTMYKSSSFYPDGGPGFVEGNSWQYTFFVPHDMLGLQQAMGGPKKFTEKLQAAFEGEKRFLLYNQPVMAYPYLFNDIQGEEWRTQAQVRRAIEFYYTADADGLPGNNDAGSLSSWLVFSAMGFYPDCPGKPFYQLGSPMFDKVTIALDPRYYSGKEFVIEVDNPDPWRHYIQKMRWNGKPFSSYQLDHREMVKGGTLTLEMTHEPKK